MITPTKKISPLQLTMCAACFLQGSVLLTGFVIRVTQQDSWAAVLLGYAIFAPLLYGFCKLMSLYPGKSLVEINEIVFGKVVGKILSLLYVYYFLSLASLNARDVANFVVTYVMPATPSWAVLVCLLGVCWYAVAGGVEVFGRFSAFFVLASIGLSVFHFALNARLMSFGNFLPMFVQPVIRYAQSTHTILSVLIGELYVLSMIWPSVSDTKKAASAMQYGLIIGSVSLLTVVIRDVAILGRLTDMVSLPSYESIRIIKVGDLLTRSEILFAVIRYLVEFFKVTSLFYATALGLAQIFELADYKYILPALAFFVGAYAMFTFENPMENAEWLMSVGPFYSTFFVYVLPTILAAGILVKRRKEKKQKIRAPEAAS